MKILRIIFSILTLSFLHGVLSSECDVKIDKLITISLIPLASLKIIGTSKFKNPCVKYLNSYTLMSIFAFLILLIYLH